MLHITAHSAMICNIFVIYIRNRLFLVSTMSLRLFLFCRQSVELHLAIINSLDVSFSLDRTDHLDLHLIGILTHSASFDLRSMRNLHVHLIVVWIDETILMVEAYRMSRHLDSLAIDRDLDCRRHRAFQLVAILAEGNAM